MRKRIHDLQDRSASSQIAVLDSISRGLLTAKKIRRKSPSLDVLYLIFDGIHETMQRGAQFSTPEWFQMN